MSVAVIEAVRQYLEQLLPSMGMELFDLQFRREGHGWVLRVFIDAEGGVSLDHCSDVSRELGDYLDVEDLINHAYHLEVSSPGLERAIRNLDEFGRYLGKKAKIKLHEPLDGQKTWVGIIRAVQDPEITIELDSGKTLSFTYDMLNKARLSL